MRTALRRLGRGLWRTFRYALVITVALLTIALVAVGIAWEYPDLWLREPTLARLARALPPEVHIDWSSASVLVEKDGFWTRRFSFEFADLRVRTTSLSAHARSLSLDATLRIGVDGVRVAVDDLRLDGKTLIVDVPENSKAERQTVSQPFRLPTALGHLDVRRVHATFEDAKVTVGKTFSHFSAELDARPDGRGIRWNVGVEGRKGRPAPGEVSADAELRLTSLAGPWFGPYAAKVYLRVDDPNVGRATLTAAGTPTLEGRSEFRGALTAVLPSKVQVRSAFTVAFAPDRLDVAPSGKVLLPSGPLAAVEFSRCPISMPLPLTDVPSTLRCVGRFQSRDPKERWNGQSWRLEASRKRWTLAFDDLVGVPSANARLVVDVAGPSQVPFAERKLVAAFDAKIGDYAALARRLYPGELSIPQPFAALAGDVRLRADWEGKVDDFSKGEVVVPWSAKTALASETQRFRTDAKGTYRWRSSGRRPELEAEALLADVALDLPEMNLAPIRVMPDPRIRPFETASPVEEPGLRYRVVVKTPTGHPVTLRSNLAQGPIPVAVDLLLTDDAGPRGSMTVLSFPVEFFKRRGELERLQVAFAAKGGKPVIDGVFRVKYAEYVITLKAIGPADRPTFEASSEPPLPQRDVWAALLFGRKLESSGKDTGPTSGPLLSTAPQTGSPFASRLSTEDARSASEMQAAAVDGGLSLATMYLLASTPVESVSYNPASGEFRAAVRLADGAALTVGSDLKSTGSVGFRYRLGNNWYVTTTLEDAFDFENTRLGTRLEWTRRY